MPLTGNASANIKELSDQCKKRGKFGTQKRTDFKTCHLRAVAAGLSAARRRAKTKGRKRAR
jgi:hypothetical protein